MKNKYFENWTPNVINRNYNEMYVSYLKSKINNYPEIKLKYDNIDLDSMNKDDISIEAKKIDEMITEIKNKNK
jgi:hypothetical protein